MQKGDYCFQDNMRSLIRKGEEDKYSKYFRREPKGFCDRLLIKAVNTVSLFSNRKGFQNCDNSYGALYVANNYDKVREVKLMDENNKKVKVFFVSEKSKEDYLNLYNMLSDVYHMPKLHHDSLQLDNSLCISLIDKMKPTSEYDVIKDICASHIRLLKKDQEKHLKKCRNLKVRKQDKPISSEASLMIETLRSRLSSQDICSTSYLTCLQHGDLSADNIIYGKADGHECCWWIDWEHLQERVFFYDVFFYILNTAVADQNYVPTEEFLAGCYDEYLEQLFNAAGYVYEASKRRDYFTIFAIDFVQERLWQEGIQNAIKVYKEYFDKYFD